MSRLQRVACVAALLVLYVLGAYLDAPAAPLHRVEQPPERSHACRLQAPQNSPPCAVADPGESDA